jgi:hypothetical protein
VETQIKKPSDFNDAITDANGTTGYWILPDGSLDVFITGGTDTMYIRISSFESARRLWEGLGRIKDVREL